MEGWLSPRGGIVATVVCPLPAVGIVLEKQLCVLVQCVESRHSFVTEPGGDKEMNSTVLSPSLPPYSGEFV